MPWGYPCQRTEGGAHTGKGVPEDSCDVGVPSGVNIANRRFIVDPTIGAVVAFCTFGAGNANGGSGSPDTHLFRVENGKLRYVHTLTHLQQQNFRDVEAGVQAADRAQIRPVEPAERHRTRRSKPSSPAAPTRLLRYLTDSAPGGSLNGSMSMR